MKKVILMALAASLLMAGCKKDDEEGKFSLIGKTYRAFDSEREQDGIIRRTYIEYRFFTENLSARTLITYAGSNIYSDISSARVYELDYPNLIIHDVASVFLFIDENTLHSFDQNGDLRRVYIKQ